MLFNELIYRSRSLVAINCTLGLSDYTFRVSSEQWTIIRCLDNNKVPGAKNEIDAVKTEVKTPE